MDKYLLQKKIEEYSEEIIVLDNYLINRVGIIRTASHIKIGEYYINCVPIELGLFKIKAISVLSEDEIKLFSELENKKRSIHLTFMHPFYSNEIKLFGVIDGISFKPNKERSEQVYIDMTFRQLPLDYNEILVDLIDSKNDTVEFYGNAENGFLNWNHMKLALISDESILCLGEKKYHTKLVYLKPDKAAFLVLDAEIEPEQSVKICVNKKPYTIFLKGVVEKVDDVNTSILIVVVKLEYNFSYVDVIRKLYKEESGSQKEAIEA